MMSEKIIAETVSRHASVRFFFDPICPWTWMTSRWLVEVERQRDLDIEWQPLSLSILSGGIVENMPGRFQEAARFSRRAQRVMTAMQETGRNDLVGALYTAIGTRIFLGDEVPGHDLLEEAALACDAASFLDAGDDASLDDAIEASTEEAMRLAGPDVGSPVLAFPDRQRGIFGPIVSPAPTGREALRVWDAMVTLMDLPDFFELKRGRTAAPQLRPAGREAARIDR